MTGRRFGRLVVTSGPEQRRIPSGTTSLYWMCSCDCGNTKLVRGASLRNGTTKSCGCLQREIAGQLNLVHGYARVNCKHPLFSIWTGMISRCTRQSDTVWKHYGGRGITVCDRWRTFEHFLFDMGPGWHPGLTIDRIDSQGNYEPSNCRWATHLTQNRNSSHCRYLSYKGERKPASQWVEELYPVLRIKYATLMTRLYTGWPVNLALSTPRYGRRQ